jgi:phosphocarrier protein
MEQNMTVRTATIASRVGLHARPAAIFADAVGRQGLEVTIARQGDPADEAMDAASILSLMGLGITHGEAVILRAEGPGADKALEDLVRILETDHDAE